MAEEQLTIMKVIQFPKNKEMETKKKQGQIEFVETIIEYMINNDLPFNLVLKHSVADEMFELDITKLKEYLIITNNYDETRKIRLDENYSISSLSKI